MSPATTPPPRPGPRGERAAALVFFAASPRLQHRPQTEPPESLRPWEHVVVERGGGLDPVSATWYPAMTAPSARGAVLLLHPWVDSGRSYFHRRGRIEALREAGYHALTVDFGGFGGTRRRPGFLDLDVETALDTLRRLAGDLDLPLHVWGVSAGAYWTHMVLARQNGVLGAMFEDVSPHLLEWSWRMAPWGRPIFLFFRTVLRQAYRYLDIRLHAPALGVRAASYVSGGRDRGVRPEDTHALAEAAGARHLIVPAADHLGAIKLATQDVIALALDTFRRAEDAAQGR